MLEIAEALGAGVDFVRVDLYCLERRVVFGELTNYPLAGRAAFEPAEFDRWLGGWWTLPHGAIVEFRAECCIEELGVRELGAVAQDVRVRAGR